MRCEECGHNISGLADDAPCTECGVVTPVARREAPPLNMRRVVLGFAWPYMAIAGVFVLLWLGIAMLKDNTAAVLFPIAIITILVLLLVPINAARQSSKLMKRLPRRTREAPLIALIPRSVMVPLLVAAAAFFLGVTFVIGACAVGAIVTMS
jgi:small-conductance mechanosensitive channel